MNMATANRVWAVVKKHVPLIKFRKAMGASSHGHVEAPEIMVAKATPPPAPTTIPAVPVSTVVEDWQMSARYKRRIISQEEIDCINRGGGLA